MNNAKYEFFPFLRLVYYIRAATGVVTALAEIPKLISGQEEIYQYILSLIYTLLTFFLARYFTKESINSKIPVIFALLALKESAGCIMSIFAGTDEHLQSLVMLYILNFLFYTVMAVLCRFSFKGYTSELLIYTACACLSAVPFISFWGIMENAFLQGEPEIISMSFSLVSAILTTFFNYVTVYISATRKKYAGNGQNPPEKDDLTVLCPE